MYDVLWIAENMELKSPAMLQFSHMQAIHRHTHTHRRNALCICKWAAWAWGCKDGQSHQGDSKGVNKEFWETRGGLSKKQNMKLLQTNNTTDSWFIQLTCSSIDVFAQVCPWSLHSLSDKINSWMVTSQRSSAFQSKSLITADKEAKLLK